MRDCASCDGLHGPPSSAARRIDGQTTSSRTPSPGETSTGRSTVGDSQRAARPRKTHALKVEIAERILRGETTLSYREMGCGRHTLMLYWRHLLGLEKLNHHTVAVNDRARLWAANVIARRDAMRCRDERAHNRKKYLTALEKIDAIRASRARSSARNQQRRKVKIATTSGDDTFREDYAEASEWITRRGASIYALDFYGNKRALRQALTARGYTCVDYANAIWRKTLNNNVA